MTLSRTIGLAAAAALAATVVAAEDLVMPGMPQVEMRLLDGGQSGERTDTLLAGVEIRLQSGWKTYWRHPGASGIAPSFDFSASTNVAEVEVLYPAPSISHDGFGWVIGYENEVIFPLEVTPQDPGQPVELVLDLSYAVCAQICVPLHGADTRELAGSSLEGIAINHYRDLVPVALDMADPRGVVEITRVDNEDGTLFELTVPQAPGHGEPRLIVEGAKDWLFAVLDASRRTETGDLVFQLPAASVLSEDEGPGAELLVTGISTRFSFTHRVTIP